MNTSNLIVLTDEEKRIVKELDHRLYTVEFLEEWINHDDNVFIDAPAALQTMMACGYYEAVKMMAKQDTQQRKNAWRDPVYDQPEPSARCADQDTAALVPAEGHAKRRETWMK